MTFEAATQAEANLLADEWWMKQKGLRLVRRNQGSVGWGPSLTQVDKWTVMIHYEPKNSNQ
jgi:hypothetical protein